MSIDLLKRRMDLLMLPKQEPHDIVKVYTRNFTIPSGSGKVGSQWWFTFRTDAIYDVEATVNNISGSWRVYFLGGSDTTIISGNLNNYSGGKITATFKFTNPPTRLNVYISNSPGTTASVKLTETIPHS